MEKLRYAGVNISPILLATHNYSSAMDNRCSRLQIEIRPVSIFDATHRRNQEYGNSGRKVLNVAAIIMYPNH